MATVAGARQLLGTGEQPEFAMHQISSLAGLAFGLHVEMRYCLDNDCLLGI